MAWVKGQVSGATRSRGGWAIALAQGCIPGVIAARIEFLLKFNMLPKQDAKF